MSANKNPAAGVVIKKEEGKYLLVQEKWEEVRGLWNLPAGIQDKGESLQQTAAREAHEEVGLIVEITDKKPLFIKKSDRSGRSLFSFTGEIVGGELVAQPEEILGAKFFSLETVEKMLREGKIRDEWAIVSIREAERRE